MNTLLIVSHPYPQQSRVTKALQETGETVSGVTVRNLESLYGHDTMTFDVSAEQAVCEDKDRIVFLYPTHWFNLTPMLKAYLNEVWAYGWAFGPGGEALSGKELLVVTSAGGSEFTYSDASIIKSSMNDVLTPMKASALYVGMNYLPPLAFYEVAGNNKDNLPDFQRQFAARLKA